MTSSALTSKAAELLRLHTDPDLLVLVNVWEWSRRGWSPPSPDAAV